MYEYVRMHVRL